MKKVKKIILKLYIHLFVEYCLIFPILGFIMGSLLVILIHYFNIFVFKQSTLNNHLGLTFYVLFSGIAFSIFAFCSVIKDFIIKYKNLQKFKKLPLEEQLKKIEAIEAQKALRKSQRKRG